MFCRIPMKSLGTVRSTCKKLNTSSKVRSFAKKHITKPKVAAEAKESETMADLPQDLVEEVLSRLPMTSLKSVRSTCRTWNTLLKHKSFATKHLSGQAKAEAGKDESMLVLTMDYKIHLMRVNLDMNVDSFMNREGTLVNLDDSDQIDVSQVFHCCQGLLLWVSEDNTRLVVWNPYLGQSRCIKPTHSFERSDLYTYALGYDKNTNSHKVLSFVDYTFFDVDFPPTSITFAEYTVYDVNSDSWRLLDVNPDWIMDHERRVSVKGNTYWLAKRKSGVGGSCLLCFDFTSERFGPRLPLPRFVRNNHYTLALSSVREEQIAILFQPWDELEMQIWVTTKVEPDTMSWSRKVFLAVDMSVLTFRVTYPSFFIDEEKKVAVVFDKDEEGLMNSARNVAYIVGVDGSLKTAYLGDSPYKHCLPRVCSYVPSLVQLN